MTLRNVLAFACLLSIIVSCSTEPEQNPVVPNPKATIKGVVLDIDSNEPIYNAKITTNPATKEIHTDLDGYFVLDDLPPKEYMVYGYTPGFDDDSVLVSIADGDTAIVNLYLNNFGEYLDYYPLDIGNYWEYWASSPAYSFEVVSDTLISGKTYQVIERVSIPSQYKEYRYERVDNFNAVVYRYFPEEEKELMIDSLPAKSGQFFTSNLFYDPERICFSVCGSITDKQIFNDTMKVRSAYHYCATDLPRYQIVKGLGLYSVSFWRTGGYMLKYAIIKGVEYGEK